MFFVCLDAGLFRLVQVDAYVYLKWGECNRLSEETGITVWF